MAAKLTAAVRQTSASLTGLQALRTFMNMHHRTCRNLTEHNAFLPKPDVPLHHFGNLLGTSCLEGTEQRGDEVL